MTEWIKAIFALAPKMGALADAISEEMDALSMDLVTNTYRVFEKMMMLENKKRRVVNFKVFRDLLKGQLTKDEYAFVRMHIVKGKTFVEIAEVSDYSKSGASRKFKEIMHKCEEYMQKLTYSVDRLIEEYKDIELVSRTMGLLK